MLHIFSMYFIFDKKHRCFYCNSLNLSIVGFCFHTPTKKFGVSKLGWYIHGVPTKVNWRWVGTMLTTKAEGNSLHAGSLPPSTPVTFRVSIVPTKRHFTLISLFVAMSKENLSNFNSPKSLEVLVTLFEALWKMRLTLAAPLFILSITVAA